MSNILSRRRRDFLHRGLATGLLLGARPALRPAIAESYPLAAFIRGLPKAELHIHFEGVLVGADVLRLAEKHGIAPPYDDLAAIEAAYARIKNTPTFLEAFAGMTSVIRDVDDHHALAWRYFERSYQENVRHIEMFFEPQLQSGRGVAFETIIEGLARARMDASRRLGMSVGYILTFYRDYPLEDALALLEKSAAYREHIVGVGLDNPQIPGVAAKFAPLFARARDMGYRCTTHVMVDEDNARTNIREAIEILDVSRIDHGINVLDDPALIALARDKGVGFNVCPSLFVGEAGYRLAYFEQVAQAVKRLLAEGIAVSINSDDPGFFANVYLNEVYLLTAEAGGFGPAEMARLARNSFDIAWLAPAERRSAHAAIDAWVAAAT